MPVLDRLLPSPLGIFVTGADLLGRSTLPEGTRLDIGGRAARRGVVPGAGQTILTPGTGGGYVPITLPLGVLPPEQVPPSPPTGPVVSPPPVPAPPTIVPTIPTVGIVGSIPNVPGFPPPPPPSAGPSPTIGAGQSVPTREEILRRQGTRTLEQMGQREARARARAAAAERAFRRRAILRGAGAAASRIFGVVGGVLWPSDVATGLPTPEQVAEMEREAAREAARGLGEVVVRARRLPVPTKTPELERIESTANRQAVLQTGPPVPAPAPSQQPATTTATRSARQSILGRLPWQQIILGALLGGPIRGTRSTVQSAVGTAPLTGVQPQALPSSGGGTIFTTGTSTSTCDCPPKKKRKTRKCLERAPVEWRSGRYKGKLAGTKCVRFQGE